MKNNKVEVYYVKRKDGTSYFQEFIDSRTWLINCSKNGMGREIRY